ncbi:MAG: hypothetical protein MK317_09330, partial [Pseudomonadales bacterium]|nr:hypothetical protein [Pseudomonadales bacterium]
SFAAVSESNLPNRLDNANGEEAETNDEMANALISAEEVLVTDYPLNEALNVLKGINALNPNRRVNTSGNFAQRDN